MYELEVRVDLTFNRLYIPARLLLWYLACESFTVIPLSFFYIFGHIPKVISLNFMVPINRKPTKRLLDLSTPQGIWYLLYGTDMI